MALSARKQIAALLVQIERAQASIKELQPAADLEPEEFDGAKVVVGSNVIIKERKDKVDIQTEATVVAVKHAKEGEKGPGTLIKVSIGSGFELETKVVYPAQILGYALVKAA